MKGFSAHAQGGGRPACEQLMLVPRLFVGIEPNDAVRDFVLEVCARLSAAGLSARFQSREKLHMTLAFLAAVPDDRQAAVAANLAAALSALRSFRVTFDVLGAFPQAAKVRVLWVGSAHPNPDYAACVARVRGALAPLGFAFDGEATAHLTLARFKTPLLALPKIDLPAPAQQQVEELALFESLPAGGMTRYEVRQRFGLKS